MHPNDGRLCNLILQALKNEDITIYGDGKQTRSFCFVDDLIYGMQAFMNSKDELKGPLNLGNPHEVTIKKLAKIIIRLVGSTAKIIHKDLPNDDPKRRKPDITLAKKELAWEPKVKIEEGLMRTIEYFKRIIK